MTPDEPEELPDSEPEAPAEEPPPPEPADEAQAEEDGWAEAGEEWIEEYEEEFEPEEPKKPKKPAKERHVFGPVALLVIVLLLILWTFWSPKVMSVTGDMYIGSVTYASLGNETFAMDVGVAADLVDAGHVVWGVSINGSGTAVVGQSAVFRITLSKVAEDPSNFFFRGTAVKLEEVSLFEDDGTFLGTSHEYEATRLAVTASVSVTFDEPGEHDLVVYVRFTVYEVMRLGYLPCKDVELKNIELDGPVVVS